MDVEETALSTAIPQIKPARDLGPLAGKPISRVEIVTLGERWARPLAVKSIRVGEPLTHEASRRAMREIMESGGLARTQSGGFARASAEVEDDGQGGAVLRIYVLPRRTIATIQVLGSALDLSDTLEAASVNDGGELTAPMLPQIAAAIKAHYAKHGFPAASVSVDTSDTDDPSKVMLSIEIKAGAPHTIARRVFVIDPGADREVGDLKQKYALGAGARVDEEALLQADREMAELLRQNGFHRAEVNHAVQSSGSQSFLYVYLTPGPRLLPAFDGNVAFDSDQLTAALALDGAMEVKPPELADKLATFYRKRGLYDVEVKVTEQGGAADPVHYLLFSIRENQQVRVTKRGVPVPRRGDER